MNYFLQSHQLLKCLADSEFLDRLNHRKWKYLHKSCFSYEIIESFIYCRWTHCLKVERSSISQVILQFKNYIPIIIYRSWQHITVSVSTGIWHMFPFIFANSPFPCISATFLNNIFCDMSTFSSFLNYVTALVQLLHLTYNKQLEKEFFSS